MTPECRIQGCAETLAMNIKHDFNVFHLGHRGDEDETPDDITTRC